MHMIVSLIINVAMRSNKIKHLGIKTKQITVFFPLCTTLYIVTIHTYLYKHVHNLETTIDKDRLHIRRHFST